ncbi:hypothetical protein GIB67_029090 [Kingdonia uniflora]|uniref:Uncharacterized protein n=1 Tax=Kingdonia uniflora TaxID=39325 RepID=A0A7J7N6I6_9MAGN|nr:hypothetical protein GIB67_029090 [Kingdonia uniflora]
MVLFLKNKEIADGATSVVKKVRRSVVWTRAHRKKNGEAVNELVQEKIDKIDEINSNNPDVGDHDLIEVLGPEYPGRMRATILTNKAIAVVKEMALNMGMLASYDQSVELFKDQLDFGEASTGVGASAVSGFFAAVCSLPLDYVKTQIQKMQPDATEKYPYKCSLNCAMKTLKAGGPFKLYGGFPVYCIRIAPHVMFIEEAEQSLHNTIMIIRRGLKNSTIVVDGGAIDMGISWYLRQHAQTIAGKSQLFINVFAKALEGITVETSLKNCKASMKFTLIGERRMYALARSQNPNQQILNRYDGDSTIGHRLYKEITKVEFVKMKGKGRLTQPTNNYQCTIVTEVESFKQIGL